MIQRRNTLAAFVSLLLPLVFVLPVHLARAQRVIEMRGFKFSEYYDAPDETKVKLRLQGAKAQPMPGGVVLVSMARVETYRADGLPELVVEAPECIHNSTGRVLSSSGPLLVKTADGSFSIRGEGFMYQQTNATLFISNNVETVATPELFEQGSEQPEAQRQGSGTGEMHIIADTFRYSADEGAGVYEGNVTATGTNIVLSSGRLSLKLPIEERRLHEISAEENVSLQYAGMNATGRRAVYNVDSGIADVTGDPAWNSEGRMGRADEFTIDRTNRVVQANGNAWLKLAGQSLAANMLPNLDAGRATNAPRAQASVEIRCGEYTLTTNQINFKKDVRLTEFEGTNAAGKLSCQNMTATFMGTNELERLVAEKGVVIERDDARFMAETATYTGTNQLMQLRGSPSWVVGDRQGKGDIIDMDGGRREMLVKGNASMRMPASSLRSQLVVDGSPPPPPDPQKPEIAEIFSEEYFVKQEAASFHGGVYISHPQMAWTCETVGIQFPANGEHVEKVVAEQQVSFNFVDKSGQQVQGRGDSATYNYSVSSGRTNELIELTGNPVIETTNGVFRNRVILYDLAANKVMAPGRYSVRGFAPAIETNSFRLPK